MSDSASIKVALVGPTHPYKGGVAAHTTALAHELEEAGHEVALVSWSHLYPPALYPGEQAVPDGSPDARPFPGTTRPLSWARPDSWAVVWSADTVASDTRIPFVRIDPPDRLARHDRRVHPMRAHQVTA